jgi:imidazolonepropionase-like amidohydrolase
MKKTILFYLTLFSFCARAQVAIEADTIYTMDGSPIVKGVILIRDGKIETVGQNISIPQGYILHTARVVTPGLIDARSTAGLSGAYNVPSDQDQLEKSNPIQPELRAIDAYNPEEKLVSYLRKNGVTTIHTGHGWGALMSGQTMVAKLKTGYIDDVTITPAAMVAMTLGPSISPNFQSPGNRSKQIAMLRTELLKAKAGLKDTSKGAEIKMLALQQLLSGKMKALISCHTATDILSAIRLSKEFGLKLVLEGVSEAYRVIPQIKESGAEVIVHATMQRAGEETLNMTMENASILYKAGIPVSIESGFEAYVPKTRIVLFEAAAAVANGLPRIAALESITVNPAKLLGIEKRVGRIAKGMDADFVFFDGDPFEYTTRVTGVMIEGQIMN